MVKLATPTPSKQQQLNAIAWVALEKIGQKQKDSDLLPAGTRHVIDLELEGNVDGRPFAESVHSVLSIGKQQAKTSSVNPQVPELIAWILGKLNRATRNRILLDLPSEFVANGNQMPQPNQVLVSEVEHLLKQLRRTKIVHARGSVRCQYTVD